MIPLHPDTAARHCLLPLCGLSMVIVAACAPPPDPQPEPASRQDPLRSPDSSRRAYIKELAPAWVVGPGGAPLLQFQGELWLATRDGLERRVDGFPADFARVLGWAGDHTLLVTRYEPGDLPTETLHRLDLRGAWMRRLVPRDPSNRAYNITYTGGRVVYARGDSRPIITLPLPDQSLQLVISGLWGRVHHTLDLPRAEMPVDIRLERGRALHYRVEGGQVRRRVDLRTGRTTEKIEPIPHIPPPSEAPMMASLSMPYVHQVYDTPNAFNGNWACGPTSTLMAVCHFGRLKTWPITVSIPYSHTSNYGAYVSEVYKYGSTTFNRMQKDASGKAAYGAYGWCTDNGAGWAWRMQDYAKRHGLSSDFYWSSTTTPIKQALDAGKVVVLSTKLTSAGHIITVKGYNSSGNLITNDPYGDKNKGYKNYHGENAVYTWGQVGSKWYITVYGTIIKPDPAYKASLEQKSGPSAMTSGAVAQASMTYKNLGTATWDSKIRLGTTNPRDRKSAFYTAGKWINSTRAAAAPSPVKKGSTATFSFTLTAPKVCKTTEYIEYFNLVQESVAWFSDSTQGGPPDKTAFLKITVNPVDADGDKHNNCTDCDDKNPKIYPGAVEMCNGLDDDCDGKVDEGADCGKVIPDLRFSLLDSGLQYDGGSPPGPALTPEWSLSGGCSMTSSTTRGLPGLLLLLLYLRRRRG